MHKPAEYCFIEMVKIYVYEKVISDQGGNIYFLVKMSIEQM